MISSTGAARYNLSVGPPTPSVTFVVAAYLLRRLLLESIQGLGSLQVPALRMYTISMQSSGALENLQM